MADPATHRDPRRPPTAAEAERLAETVRAFGSASRLRLLWALMDGERSVEQLSLLAGMTQSATSHQLRLLRQLHLVVVRRDGRHAFYSLHDHHLPDLLGALRHHHEHLADTSGPSIRSETP
jgi:DNA-binding transcriptional ArsR family regulator